MWQFHRIARFAGLFASINSLSTPATFGFALAVAIDGPLLRDPCLS